MADIEPKPRRRAKGAAAARTGRSGAPGRRCARQLSSGRDRGAVGCGNRTRLAGGHFGRRGQCRDRRWKPARTPRRAASRILGSGDELAAELSDPARRSGPRILARMVGGLGRGGGGAGILRPALRCADVRRAGDARCAQFLRFDSAQGDSRRTDRLGSAQRRSGAAIGRRGRCRKRQFPLFRHRRGTARRAACDGLGRAAAGAAADRDRREILVGRRARLEHPAPARPRQPDRGNDRLPGRSIRGGGGHAVHRSWTSWRAPRRSAFRAAPAR